MPDVNKIVSPKISLEKGGFIKRANHLMKNLLLNKYMFMNVGVLFIMSNYDIYSHFSILL